MKKILTLLLISLFSCTKNVSTSNSGNTITNPPPPPPPLPKSLNCFGQPICLQPNIFLSVSFTAPSSGRFFGAFGAATSCGNKVYFGGGHEEGAIGFTLDPVLVYNIDNKTWDDLLLSVPRSHLSATYASNKVIFAGGNNISSENPVYGSAPLEYYDIADIYDNLTSAHTTGRLCEARANMAAITTGNKAFFIGGKTITGYSSKMDVYDASTNLWSVVVLPRERGYAGAVITGSKIYIAGGKNGNGNLTVIDVYDYLTDSWEVLVSPHEHPVAAVVLLNNKIFIAGGDGLTNAAVDIYDQSTGLWQSAQLSDGRFNIAVATVFNKIIFLGGNYSSFIDLYDDITKKWSSTNLTDGVNGMAATTGGDTKCYFAGFLFQNGNSLTNEVLMITP
jgi:N-acetylneuraminic acid mutarotase